MAETGTAIENANATTDVPSNYEICDYSGMRAKPGELVPTWDGKMVLPRFWEPRNDQDFVRARAEKQHGAERPEPVGNETFLSNGEVTADDL